MGVQVNRDNVQVKNIGVQNNYYANIEGTAFVLLWDCKEEKHYESIKESLYYPPEYLDKITSVLKAEHSVLIQGEQGSGKSVLSFKIAELMKNQGLVTSPYYLNPPSDWNAVKQWIQAVHFQEKLSGSKNVHLWIIDNLHKMTDGIEDFPDVSAWGSDYCICCTRDLNGIPSEEDVFFPMALSRKQTFRRKVDEKMFLQCYNALTDNKIGRHESDYLYRYVGGNLAMLRYIMTRGNLPKSLSAWKKERFIDFHNIYASYFFDGTANKNIRENPGDTLKMLFLSQIDFSIPFYLQSRACQTVLKDLYFETTNKELEMEHASLAELLTVCICKEYNLDYGNAFRESIHWALSKLVNCNIKKEEQVRQINRFFQLLYDYKFVLNENQILHEIRSTDQSLLDFLEENAGFLSCSTWKKIIETTDKNSKLHEIFYASAISPQFADAMNQNQDYDFQFFKERLPETKLDEIEKHLLSHSGDLIEFIVSKGNEVHLMHLLLSVSEKTAVKLIDQMSSWDLARLISKNNNGLYLFAYFYCRLGDEVKKVLVDKLSADDFRDIFMNGASISGFTFFLSVTEDSLRKSLLYLLTDDLIDRLIENTVENNYSIGMLNMSLREMKRESREALAAFEKAIGVNGYKELLKSQGTIPVLARLIQYSSSEMQKELTGMAQSNPELVRSLIEKTIEEGSSIGTLNLSLREMKRESVEALEAFEKATGVNGYKELLKSQGTIPILAGLIQHSSSEMQKELTGMAQSNPELVRSLIEKTIEEGSSIGTLNLSLREMKRESVEALEAFEKAIGVNGYKELLKSQGTIPVLARLIQHSSSEMQKELTGMAQSNPELVRSLIEKTIEEGSSIGTLNLSLREMKRESVETLEAFEKAMGVNGYKELLKSQGTIPILARLIQYSSSEMQKELTGMAQSNPELVKGLVKKTIDKGEKIGTLNIFIKALSRTNDSFLHIFERLIGTDGYLELFSKCNVDSITILRILACSSLSDSLVDKVYAYMVVWNESRNHISEGSCTILKDFDKDLYYAQGKGRNKFFRFFKEMVSSEELLGWIRQGATLEEAIFIMRNLPLTMARNLSMAWLKNHDQVMEGIRFVEQQRNGKQAMDPQIVNRAIIKFKSFNQEFFVAIDKEYRMLLSNRDKVP